MQRDSIGFAWVFLLCKDTRRDFQGFARCAHSHLYHRRLVQKAPDSEQAFYAHVVSMAAQRAGQQGIETGTGWQRGTGLQQPGSPSEPPDPSAATVVSVPVQGRRSALAVPVVRQLSPREYLSPLDRNGCSRVTPALRKHSAVACSPPHRSSPDLRDARADCAGVRNCSSSPSDNRRVRRRTDRNQVCQPTPALPALPVIKQSQARLTKS